MSLFDIFSGTDGTALDAHVSDGGASWIKHPNAAKFAASDAVLLSNAAALGSGVKSAYLLDEAASSADIILTGTLITGSASLGSQDSYIFFRAGSDGSGYLIGMQGSDGLARLLSMSADGALHSVGSISTIDFHLAAGGSYVFKLLVRGNAFRLFIDGLLYGIWQDTSYTAAGRIGLYLDGAAATGLTDGVRIDDLQAQPATAIPTVALNAGFNGTDGTPLSQYTSESGHSFTRYLQYSTSGDPTIRGNGLGKVGTSNEMYLADWVPPSADYPVIGSFAVRSANGQSWYLLSRVDESARNFYYFGYQSGLGLRLVRALSGFTVLGTYGFTPVAGHSYELRLEVEGSTINGYLDGELVLTATDASVTAAGKAGVFFNDGAAVTDDSTGTVLDSLTTGSSTFSIDVADYRVFQMSQIGGSTAIALTGKIPSGAADVQLRVRDADSEAVLVDWAIPTDFANDTAGWTGTLPVPNGGWYLLDMRWRDGSATVQDTQLALSHFGVGLLIATTGDSNPYYEYAGTATATSARLSLMTRETPGVWALQSTPGYGLAKLADALYGEFGVPIGSLNFSNGGSTLDAWANDNAGNATTFANQLKANGPVLCWISQVGYNDCTQSLFTTRDEQLAKFETLFSFVRGIAGNIGIGGAVLPVLIAGSTSNYSKADPAPALSVLNRQAELLVSREANNHYTISQAGVKVDGVHKTDDADGWGAFSAQMARMLIAFTRGQALPRLRITGARIVDATHTDLIVTHTGGDDLTPASGIEYVRIYDADLASELAVSAAVRQSATSIRVTHAAGDLAKRGFDYLNTPDSGEDWANVPRDNDSGGAMALEMTMDQGSIRHLVITATDDASATADLPVDLMTEQ